MYKYWKLKRFSRTLQNNCSIMELKLFKIKLILCFQQVQVVLHSLQIAMTKVAAPPMFIIISCGCCFLQSTIALIVLLPNVCIHKCYISFLKMQFCTSVSTTMAFFIMGLLQMLPKVSFDLY